jgi:hypothetical protein
MWPLAEFVTPASFLFIPPGSSNLLAMELLQGCFGRDGVTFIRRGAKDTRRSAGANGARKCDIRIGAQSIALHSVPVLDTVPTDDGAVGRGAADQAHNEARREYGN